ncbi:MAG: hypothetical protein OXG11_00885, partial [Chloroflexi bacterium]|nr:hypothetical protein [Chloroflexota bacterium]
LIGLGAAISLWGRPEPASDTWSRHKFVIGAAAIFACIVAVAVLAPRLYKWPLADARADTLAGAFQMVVDDQHSIVQELGALPVPPSRMDLRIANRSASNRPGVLAWRLIEPEEGISGKILREGRREIPARDHLAWETIDIAPPVQSGGRRFALQLIADVGPDAHLRIGATKTDRYEEGRLWIDGALGWPDQNIEFVAYSAPELTRGKLLAMWHAFTSYWRWPLLFADIAIVMTLLTSVSTLLVTAALPRRAVR